MVEYEITINNTKRLYNWILTQPNLINIYPYNPDKIYCEFNHTAPEQETFKQNIIERLAEVDIGNNTFELLLPKLRQIQTDQYFYSCEFSPGITKTNIGITYVNIFTDFSGRPFFIDTTGFTKMAIQILWNKAAGTGVHTMRIINDADSTQIIESGSLGLNAAQSDDFPNVNIPQNFLNFKGKWRLQAKSTVATDDPIFLGFRLYLRR
jgi:hypothetical protein